MTDSHKITMIVRQSERQLFKTMIGLSIISFLSYIIIIDGYKPNALDGWMKLFDDKEGKIAREIQVRKFTVELYISVINFPTKAKLKHNKKKHNLSENSVFIT